MKRAISGLGLAVLGVLGALGAGALYALGKVQAELEARALERKQVEARLAEQEVERVRKEERRRVSAKIRREDIARVEEIERKRRKLLGS